MGCHCLLQGNSRCFYIQNFFFQLNCVMSSLCTTHTHTHTQPSENVFFFFQVTKLFRGVSPPRLIQPFPCCAGVSLVSRFNRRSCSVRTAPTHGPSGAALIYGSGAEPGRQGGRSSLQSSHRDPEGCTVGFITASASAGLSSPRWPPAPLRKTAL